MAVLEWDKTGEHLYETGVSKGVLYPFGSAETPYNKGVAWSGLTSVSESPSGADATKLYADDIKYLDIRAAEEFGATIEAYQSPEEFDECDGTTSLLDGVSIGQQVRKMFGFCYRSQIGNDTNGTDHGYKLHLIYGLTASPSERSHSTINDSPEAATLSWEVSSTPVSVTGHKPTSVLTIDSTRIDPKALAALEKVLYGDVSTVARLPLPDEVKEICETAIAGE